jgi:hypothetical protein
MRKLQAAILVLLALASPGFARKPDREVQVPWAKLGKLVKGREAVVVTIAGESIEGKIRSVGAEALELDKNRQVSRLNVRGIRIEENHGHGRLWGTLIGFFGSAVVLGAATGNGESAQGSLAPIVAAVVGYAIGRNADKQALFIEVIP